MAYMNFHTPRFSAFASTISSSCLATVRRGKNSDGGKGFMFRRAWIFTVLALFVGVFGCGGGGSDGINGVSTGTSGGGTTGSSTGGSVQGGRAAVATAKGLVAYSRSSGLGQIATNKRAGRPFMLKYAARAS